MDLREDEGISLIMTICMNFILVEIEKMLKSHIQAIRMRYRMMLL